MTIVTVTVLDKLLLDGLVVLACLPTTVSMCVMMTTAMKGNASACVFNSTLGNFVGILVTPLTILLLLGSGSGCVWCCVAHCRFAVCRL